MIKSGTHLGVPYKFESTEYEKKYESDKPYLKIGYAKLTLGELLEINLSIMLTAETGQKWLGQRQKNKTVFIPKGNLDVLNALLNESDDSEHTAEEYKADNYRNEEI